MEMEGPWCKTAEPGKPGYTIGVLTNGNAIELTCVCVTHQTSHTHTKYKFVNW
jgi:hypothetical protein